ncbi:hypothetical protein E4U47_000220 [Claviceps purpurea]|nr:hypothetical protein E4U38_000176 [Claviceps purpurea]KAG6146280.1 hypothetical protein E4U28_000855 [Claviceps purpurea]KAG6276187.1 hypothetical protein E4U47_000220 [Claviceps purpurea]
MAKKNKARSYHVHLVSMAMTGFSYIFRRPRTSPNMGMMKYDPIVRRKVLFLEMKKRSK